MSIPFEIRIEKLNKGFIIQYLEDKRGISSFDNLIKEIRDIFGITSDHSKRKHKNDICDIKISKLFPGGDDGRVQPEQKSQTEINSVPQSSDSSASGGNTNTKSQQQNQEQSTTIINPFVEVPAFTYKSDTEHISINNYEVYFAVAGIAIYHKKYKINIYSTVDEIKRLKSLPEMTVKLIIRDFEKRTYPNKVIVLRHFLRELTDVNVLEGHYLDQSTLNKTTSTQPKKSHIPTFSTTKSIDDFKNSLKD